MREKIEGVEYIDIGLFHYAKVWCKINGKKYGGLGLSRNGARAYAQANMVRDIGRTKDLLILVSDKEKDDDERPE